MRKISFSNLSSGQIGQLFQSLDIHLEEANRADDEYEEVPYQAECSQNFENHWKGSILLCEVQSTQNETYNRAWEHQANACSLVFPGTVSQIIGAFTVSIFARKSRLNYLGCTNKGPFGSPRDIPLDLEKNN